MKISSILNKQEVSNQVEIKNRINEFKHHLTNMQKISKRNLPMKKSQNTQSRQFGIQYPIIQSNKNRLQSQNSLSRLQSKYQKRKLDLIQKQNNNLLKKMIKIDDSHSRYYQTHVGESIKIARNNLMMTNYNQRIRSLTQISHQNLRLSHKLFRCQSSYKFNQTIKNYLGCVRNEKNNNIQLLKTNKKSPNLVIDYRVLARQQMNKKVLQNRKLNIKIA